MARSRILDHLQTHKFHLMDITIGSNGLFPIPALNPVIGFSNITAPEMSAEIENIKAGNDEFPYKVARGGSVSTITLQRGIVFYDTDFWNWTLACVKGSAELSRRRLLLLVQFANVNVFTKAGAAAGGSLAANVALSTLGKFDVAQTVALQGGLIGVGLAAGLVPIRAWLLYNCIATRVKTGTDLDAMTGAVTIQEMDVEAKVFEQFALGI